MLTLIIIFIILLALGVPIFGALMFPSWYVLVAEEMRLTILVQRLFGGLDSFTLLSMPFFIFAANIMGVGGLSYRLVRVANLIAGRFTGGNAITTVVACLFFGALSGSSPATLAAIGTVIKPALDEDGYAETFTLGLLMGSSSLSLLIPPSITLIVFSLASGLSVGVMFMAGIVPGFLFAVIFIIYSYLYAKKNKIKKYGSVVSEREKGSKIILSSLWAIGVPVIILGGIYGGIVTPTEAAVVSCGYAILIGLFVYKDLTLPKLYEASKNTIRTIAQVMILVAASQVFAWVLTVQNVSAVMHNVLGWAGEMPWLLLLLISFIMLIAGMLIEPTSLVLIVTPIFLPLAITFGLSPIHVGLVITANAAIGIFTPPFGLDLFVIKAVFGIPYDIMIKSSINIFFVCLIGLAILIFFPQISLWLPSVMF